MENYPNGAYIFTEHKGGKSKDVTLDLDPDLPHNQIVYFKNGDVVNLSVVLGEGILIKV